MDNILTIDLEEWFHICGVRGLVPEDRWPAMESMIEANTGRILEILSSARATATFFVLGFIARHYPALIREIGSRGHEVASHGYSHRRVYTMTPPEFRDDLKRAGDAISEITNEPVKGFRAPEWSIRKDSLWALDILHQEGFEYDSSMAPLPIIGDPSFERVPHQVPLTEGRLWEFPPLTLDAGFVKLPLGGGWGLRVLPYGITRAAVRRMNRRDAAAVFHLHPREFSRKPPRLDLPLVKKLVLNARVRSTESRLLRLLRDVRFTSISGELERLESETA